MPAILESSAKAPCRISFAFVFMLLIGHTGMTLGAEAPEAEAVRSGQSIYLNQCMKCHGDRGEGVEQVNENPLRPSLSFDELKQSIIDTMPEDDPDLCVGEDAELVARYIYEEIFHYDSTVDEATASIDLSRLTVRQYRNSIADLLASFKGSSQPDDRRGLRGEYFKDRKFRGSQRAVDRIDAQVEFDFGEASPDPKIENKEDFSIRWEGSILAEETGDYEFVVTTDIGAKLWVNDDETPIIDAWVSSSGPPKEHSATLRLLGGRAYPLKLDVFKFKEARASIKLEWKPPHHPRQLIPPRNLSPGRVPEVFVVTTEFPPDDQVTGYVRGASISKAWEQATTSAALQVANHITQRLESMFGRNSKPDEQRRKAQEFCQTFTERAFRRPLTDVQRKLFIDLHFERSKDLASAVKRSVILTLMSPRFLYPTFQAGSTDDYDTAAKLAIGLWDSLPDKALIDAAGHGRLKTGKEISDQSRRMLNDPRARSKVRDFFHHWLQLDEKEALSKDKDLFPDFDEQIVSDLRTSIDLFLDELVWSDTSDYRKILLADYIYLNGRLARFYGAENDVSSDATFEKIRFEPGQRSGVLTHPYLMSTLAYYNLSSPIHRGVFVTRRLLGRTLRPPPQAIEFKDSAFDHSLTTREKVAIQTSPAACQTCHIVINPLGFPLENYDAVGRFRRKESDKPIDTATIYTTTDGQPVKIGDPRDLAEFIASSHHAHGAFVDQLFHQAVKQPINAYGPTTRDALITKFVESDFNIQQLLVEIMQVSTLYHPDGQRGKK